MTTEREYQEAQEKLKEWRKLNKKYGRIHNQGKFPTKLFFGLLLGVSFLVALSQPDVPNETSFAPPESVNAIPQPPPEQKTIISSSQTFKFLNGSHFREVVGEYETLMPQGLFFVVELEITNNTNQTIYPILDYLYIVDEQDRFYSIDHYATSFFLIERGGSAAINNYAQINPGLSNKVILAFDINSDVINLRLAYQDDFNEEYYSIPLGHLSF